MKMFVLFLSAACSLSASADTFHVATTGTAIPPYSSWATAATTIQDAIEAASGLGDLVLVADGTYSTGGKAVYGSFTNRIAIDKPVAVQSVNGPAFTFIEGAGPMGSGAIRCAYVGSNAILSGFTLTNGHTPYGGDIVNERHGGGAWCEDSGIVSNCFFTACKANAGGGAAYGTYLSCTFSNNMATSGGAAFLADLYDCLVIKNTASSGGGVGNCNSDECTFIGNQSSHSGGATYSGNNSNCVIRGNTALEHGGGCNAGTAHNCTIVDNLAASGGGGWYTSLESCTVVGNRATIWGGGLYAGTAVNCIIYYNDVLVGTNDNVYSPMSCTFTCTEPAPTGLGNISDPPKLQSLSVPRLVITSPCINAGTNEVWMAGAVDIEGDPRILNSTVEMGSDEVDVGAQFGTLAVQILTDYTTIVKGHPLKFEAHIEGDVGEFRWDWDDGDRTDNRCVAEHAFNHAGTYDVVLEAGNKTDNAAATTTVTVVESFIAYVSPSGSHAPPFTDWSMAATNIQAAIDVCIPGGTVLVAEGDYDSGERVLWGEVPNRIVVDRPITVMGEGGPKDTRIIGSGVTNEDVSVRCAMLSDGALLTGFTLTGGLADIETYPLYINAAGGAVWSTAGGTVSNCIVTGNAAESDGGGIMGGMVVESEVSANWVEEGDGGGVKYAHVRNCTISGNTSGDNGGGIAYSTAENCYIGGNIASWGGGASDSTLRDCTLSNNSASDGGGMSDCVAHNCILYGNMGVWGGGAHQSSLYGCTITGNSAFRGGGVHDWYDEGVVQSCTVVGNKASGSGGGTWGANVTNSIVYFNTAAMEYDNVDIVDYGSCAYTCTTPDPGGESNITSIPKLAGFFTPHIGKGSPCINAGTNQAWMATATDLDGEGRIYGGTVDMGADEYDHDLVVGDPRPGMVADGTYGVAGFPMRFQANCRGKVGRLEWFWGDGENDAGPCYLEHAFAVPGDYDVVLDARSSDTVNALTTTVHIVGGYTNYVSPTGSHTYPYESWATGATNIQTAVDANKYAGGVVLVANGVYASGGKVRGLGILNRILVDKAVTVCSANGPAHAIIMGSGADSVGEDHAVRCAYVGDRATLKGFTLSAGATDHDSDLGRSLRVHGAGAWCEPEGRISHCVLTGCISEGNGGGTYQGRLFDTLIYGNEADEGYGACRSTLRNCTVWDNDYYDTYDCKMLNSVVCDISTGEDYLRESLCQYTCSYTGPDGEGNIEEEYPGFVDSDNGDYHLEFDSLCVDAGSNGLMQSALDFEGIPRPLDGDADGTPTVDMGCYEFLSSVGDTDGDSASDYAEYVADTGILDPNDWFHISAISNGPAATLFFESSDERLYRLLWSTNLISGQWSEVSNQMGAGGADSMQSTNNAPVEFYKLEVQLP